MRIKLPPLMRLVHPFPSALNALVVLAVAQVAGGSVAVSALLAASMLGLQFCIGAVNDLCDEQFDALSKPHKPIPAGRVTRRMALVVAVAAGAVGLLLAVAVRWPDPLPLAMAALMLGAGLTYDFWLKPTSMGWICLAFALPILPLFAWYGATGTLPVRWELVIAAAALAGPALQLANGLVDIDSDARAGARTVAVALGARRSLAILGTLLIAVHALAWVTLPLDALPVVPLLSGIAGALAVGGWTASAQRLALMREIGWSAQAASIAVLAVAWLMGAAAPS